MTRTIAWHCMSTMAVLVWCMIANAVPAQAETRDLRIEGKKPAAYVASQTGKSWAVVIGINDYEKVRRLTYAKADAESVAGMLRQRGFQVAELYDQQATRTAILDELGDKLVDRVGENDRVLIFFAGHGETKQPKGGKEMGFLLPVEAEQEGLARTAIPMSLIRDLADGLPAKQVLFLVDVCYGGVAGQQFRSLPKYTAEYLKAITRERGRQLITAGGPKQQAMEGPEWGHSVFTYYVLEGLRKGMADLNSDGIIPASELYAYLDERVFSAAQMKGHQQRPVMWTLAAEKGEFVFFTNRGNEVVNAVASPPSIVSQALTQVEDELKALQDQERQMDEQARQAEQLAEKKRQIEEKKKKLQEAKKFRELLVLIPAGEFQMGSTEGAADEKPVHRVHLDDYYLDKYEVTTARYGQFMAATGHREPDNWSLVSQTNAQDRPVIGVDWHDAEAYCRWAGKRLPTEAEWEKAARGTDGRTYPWGNAAPISSLANYGKDFRNVINNNYYAERLTPVGSYEEGKGPFGIYDLAGNVWEWVADWYDVDYYSRSPAQNPKGPPTGEYRVLRGGSWRGDPQGVRSADRLYDRPADRDNNIGFRCAKTP